MLATLGCNISANSLSAANDMTVLFPRYVNIRRGQIICALIGGWGLVPWEILASAQGFLTFMSGYTVFLGPFAGIMVTDVSFISSPFLCFVSLLTVSYLYSTGWYTSAALTSRRCTSPTGGIGTPLALTGALSLLWSCPSAQLFRALYTRSTPRSLWGTTPICLTLPGFTGYVFPVVPLLCICNSFHAHYAVHHLLRRILPHLHLLPGKGNLPRRRHPRRRSPRPLHHLIQRRRASLVRRRHEDTGEGERGRSRGEECTLDLWRDLVDCIFLYAPLLSHA